MRFGAKLSADSVMVGDPFTLTVTVEVPAGARITWPTPADSNGPISLREAIKVSAQEPMASASSANGVDVSGPVHRETAKYSLLAWGVGAVPITMPDIKVHDGNVETVIPFAAPSVFVISVLPADTSLRVPKPAKSLFPRIIPWWEVWWPAFVVLALLMIVAWLIMRRKKHALARIELDPFARAERDFERLDRLKLNEAGEQGRFVALALEVMRTYFALRLAPATLALTSDELLLALAPDSRVPIQRLEPLLSEADAIKFGQQPVDGASARAFAQEARGVVSAVEQAEIARIAARRAEQKDEGRKEQQLRQEAEDKARQESRRGKSEAA
jgi:hypothetical protein